MFQCQANVADSGPVLKQYCVFGMDSRDILNATFDNKNNSCNSIQTQNVDSMLFQCWASITDSDTTLSQQRDKSMVYWIL